MLERWNDDRMDGLDAKVDGLDLRVDALDKKVGILDAKVGDLGAQMRELRQDLREDSRETKAGFESLGERLDRMQRTMLWAAVTIVVALLGSGSAIVAALLNSSHP